MKIYGLAFSGLKSQICRQGLPSTDTGFLASCALDLRQDRALSCKRQNGPEKWHGLYRERGLGSNTPTSRLSFSIRKMGTRPALSGGCEPPCLAGRKQWQLLIL